MPDPFGPDLVTLRRPGLIAGTVVYLVLLAAVSAYGAGDGVHSLDPRLLHRIQDLHGAGWDDLATLGYWFGQTLVDLAIVAVATASALVHRRYPEAALLGSAELLRALNSPLKWIFDSPRPDASRATVVEHAHGLGFPSGHVLGVTLIGGSLLIVLFRVWPDRSWRVVAALVYVVVITITAFGRVHRGAHWPSDTLGGVLWGGALLAVAVLLVGWADHHRVWDTYGRLPRPRRGEIASGVPSPDGPT